MTPLPRGTCSVCGRDVALRVNGTPHEHHPLTTVGDVSIVMCPGSGEGGAEYVYAPPETRKAKDGYGVRSELLTFVRAFRYAVEVEYIGGGDPPLWLRNGYDNARELTGLDREAWPAPWENRRGSV